MAAAWASSPTSAAASAGSWAPTVPTPPSALAALGQTLGPIAVGAVTDAFGSLSYALNLSAAMLAVGAVAAAFQKRLGRKTSKP